MMGRVTTLLAGAFFFFCCSVTVGRAQDYPERPIRLVIPFAAGGAIDLLGRLVGQELGQKLGQSIIADNRPGGGTIVGTDIVTKAMPDGYTLLLSNIALAINPSVRSKLPYHTLNDLAPIAMLATQGFAIAASPSFPANSLAELIAQAKSRPRQIVYGMAGVGSGGHIAAELLKSMAKIDLTHVGYKGGGQVVADLIANQLPVGITGLPNVVPHMKAGRIKVLAITDINRSPLAPDVPTAGETVPGYAFSNWFGVLAPRGTPGKVLARLERELLSIVQAPGTAQKLLRSGFGIRPESSREFDASLKADTTKYARVVRDAGIRVDF